MGSSSSAPEYAKTTFNSGNWGSSTNSKEGTTFTPSSWMKSTMGTVESNVNPTLQGMLTNDYSNDPNFQAYKNNLYREMSDAYDANVLSPLANRGLMRSSGLQAATNSFNNTLNNSITDLYDNYYSRQANNLSNLLNVSNTLYNYMAGITGKNQTDTQAVNDYNMKAYQAEQAANANLFNTLANNIGAIGSSYLGGKK